jgi:hypothetical protein
MDVIPWWRRLGLGCTALRPAIWWCTARPLVFSQEKRTLYALCESCMPPSSSDEADETEVTARTFWGVGYRTSQPKKVPRPQINWGNASTGRRVKSPRPHEHSRAHTKKKGGVLLLSFLSYTPTHEVSARLRRVSWDAKPDTVTSFASWQHDYGLRAAAHREFWCRRRDGRQRREQRL